MGSRSWNLLKNYCLDLAVMVSSDVNRLVNNDRWDLAEVVFTSRAKSQHVPESSPLTVVVLGIRITGRWPVNGNRRSSR